MRFALRHRAAVGTLGSHQIDRPLMPPSALSRLHSLIFEHLVVGYVNRPDGATMAL